MRSLSQVERPNTPRKRHHRRHHQVVRILGSMFYLNNFVFYNKINLFNFRTDERTADKFGIVFASQIGTQEFDVFEATVLEFGVWRLDINEIGPRKVAIFECDMTHAQWRGLIVSGQIGLEDNAIEFIIQETRILQRIINFAVHYRRY